jgi:hypothetical protein
MFIRPSEEIKKTPLLKVQEEVYIDTVLSSSSDRMANAILLSELAP